MAVDSNPISPIPPGVTPNYVNPHTISDRVVYRQPGLNDNLVRFCHRTSHDTMALGEEIKHRRW